MKRQNRAAVSDSLRGVTSDLFEYSHYTRIDFSIMTTVSVLNIKNRRSSAIEHYDLLFQFFPIC